MLPGVTLNLVGQQASGDNPVSLVVSADTNAINSDVQNFISNYNTALSYLNSQTAINASTGAPSALSDEPMYENLIGTLRSTVSAAISDTGSSQVQTLADVGITQAADGTLSINTGTLDQALSIEPLGRGGPLQLDERHRQPGERGADALHEDQRHHGRRNQQHEQSNILLERDHQANERRRRREGE